jgi:RimJ/RimL family protein N-acetyltransferase/glycosyltransferase involved in cell wall biosynthesis
VTEAVEIIGERTRLRPLGEADLKLLAEWRNRHRLSFVDSSPVSVEGQARWYASYRSRDDDLMYVIETLEGRPLGSVSLYHVDREAGSAEFGRLMIGGADDEGHGYAADASRALLDHARTALGLELVYLQAIAENRRAVALYERLGFVRDPLHDASVAREDALIELAGMSLSLVPEARPASTQSDRPGRPIHVAVVHPGLTPSTYIRLLSPLAWLEKQGYVTPTFVPEEQLEPSRREIAGLVVRGRSFHREARLAAEQALREADVVIIQRSTSPLGERALTLARAAGTGVVYECDDNFLTIDRSTPAVGAYYSSKRVRRRFVKMLADAAVVTTSTDVLAAAFGEFSADVRTLPNCVDFAHLDRRPRPATPSGVVIGYAGTVTHGPDFECVEPALRRVLDEGDGTVRLQFFGFVPETLLERPDVGFVPYTEDYPGFMRTLGRVDWSFGIAPLADLPVNRGKTNNKYREYGACRIPAVYSDCPVYSGSVSDGLTGLLVPHTEEGWYAGLKRMMADAALRESVTRAANDDVAERYSVTAAAQAWLDTLQDVLSRTRR